MRSLVPMMKAVMSSVARGLGMRATMSADRAVGARGEREAARFLRRAGYRVKGRNLRLNAGEIDLLCLDPDGRTIVVVEVKTRVRSGAAGESRVSPEAAITAHKRTKLASLTRSLRRSNRWEDRPARIDVVAVEMDGAGGVIEVRHFVDAVRW